MPWLIYELVEFQTLKQRNSATLVTLYKNQFPKNCRPVRLNRRCGWPMCIKSIVRYTPAPAPCDLFKERLLSCNALVPKGPVHYSPVNPERQRGVCR
eukprot:sb/3479004/